MFATFIINYKRVPIKVLMFFQKNWETAIASICRPYFRERIFCSSFWVCERQFGGNSGAAPNDGIGHCFDRC